MKLFGINTQLKLQSELSYNTDATKSALIINLLKQIDANIYLSGNGAKVYQKAWEFEQHNIKLLYQNYKQHPYKQYKTNTFIPGLASLDLLFNVGKNNAKNYI
jgi:hypothetical protein